NKSSTDDASNATIKELWTGAVLLDDESCLLSGSYAVSPYYTTAAIFGKVNASGNRAWVKSVPNVSGINYATTVAKRANGTFLLAGMNGQCGFVAPIDATGTIGTVIKIKYAICATSSNGFQIPVQLLDRTVAGKSVLTAVILRDEYSLKTVVANVEADGSVLTSFQHADPSNNYVNEPRAATVLTDGRILVVGRTNEPGGGGGDDATLTFLQPDLTGEVRKRYGAAPNEVFHAVARLPDNTIVAAGARSTGSNPPEAIVMRMAADGTLLWQKAFTGTGAYELRAAVAADDGAFFLAGRRPEANNTAKSNLWMLALDADGDTFWTSEHGLSDTDEGAVALVRHPASGRLTAFGSRMSTNGTADFYGVRVTEGGAVSCAAAGKCVPSVTPTCADSDPCTASLCFNSVCVHQTQVAGCNDGDACTSNEVCSSSGVCGGGAKVYCDDSNPCTTETCNKTAGCLYSIVVDGTPCATGKTCSSGVCQ
ncbi:MAG: hypothetical protein HY902_00025, partial [Deltaproteobacteria bacterium]|nr:hypothetical protein [Deltaproteobacteria bacterium]